MSQFISIVWGARLTNNQFLLIEECWKLSVVHGEHD